MANCLPLFDYGSTTGHWAYKGEGYRSMTIRPHDEQPELTVTSSIGLGLLGERCYGRTTLEEGQSGFVALSWRGSAPGHGGGRVQGPGHHRRVLAQLVERRHLPRSSLAALHRAQRPHLEGPQLCPHRRHHGRARPPLCLKPRAGPATGTTATPGSGTPRSCCARCTGWASTGRRSSTSASYSRR